MSNPDKSITSMDGLGAGRMPRVAVVILNWNGWRDTIECLESLGRISYDPFVIIVVDNGSTDESIQKLRDYCKGQVEVQSRFPNLLGVSESKQMVEYTRAETEQCSESGLPTLGSRSNGLIVLIRNERNFGFAEGSNIGIRFALSTIDPSYILLLNNDTVVDPAFLTQMVRVGESNSRIGIVGPKILYYDFRGESDVIWYAGGRIDVWREWVFQHIGVGERDQGQFDAQAETEWCTGAAFLMKKELAKTALLNSAYLFGTEDVEYSINARKHGFAVVYAPTAKVWHKVGVSREKVGNRIRRDIPGYLGFVRRNFSTHVYYCQMMLFLVVVLPRWVFTYVVSDRSSRTFDNFITGVRKLTKSFIRR